MAATQFDWETEERKNKRTGAIVSTILHLLLLLMLLWLGLFRQIPPPGEKGISVVFGTSDVGSGEQAPTSMQPDEMKTPPVEEEVIEEVLETEATPVEEVVEAEQPIEEVVTQDFEEAPVVTPTETVETPTEPIEEPVKEPVKEPTPEKEPVEEPKPEVAPDPTPIEGSTFGGFKSDQNTKGSKGDDNVSGDKGDERGDPDGKNWKGANDGLGDFEGGKGDWYLGGRSLKKKAIPDDNSQKTGVVVVSITVNRAGKVTNATCCTAKGSTTKDPGLVAKAIEAAYKYEFDAKTDAPAEQQGFLRFVFKLQ